MFNDLKAFLFALDVPGFVPPLLLGLGIGFGAYALFKLIIANRPRSK
jgi:hypothetical protein